MSTGREAAIRAMLERVHAINEEDANWLLAELAAAREHCPFCGLAWKEHEQLACAILDATEGQE